MIDEAPSLRDTIESAMEAHTEAPEVAPEPVEAPDAAVEASPEPASTETPAEAAARVRDGKGRFAAKTEKPAGTPEGAKKAGTEPVAAVKGKTTGAEPPAAPVVKPAETAPKAPQSFRPAARELAAKLPAEFRPILDEAVRIDNDAKRALNDSAQARQLASQVQQSLAPYESIARANGMDAMTFAGRALQDISAIYSGAPQNAVAVVAGAVTMLQQRFGPQALEMINAAIEGKAVQSSAQQPPQDVNALVQQAIEQRMRAAAQQGQQRMIEAELGKAETFLSGQKYGADVRSDFANILDVWAKNGKALPLTQHDHEQAYRLACQMNTEVAPLFEQDRATEALRAQAPTVQRAKVAASSIRASPGVAATRSQGPQSIRETIEAAMAGQRT